MRAYAVGPWATLGILSLAAGTACSSSKMPAGALPDDGVSDAGGTMPTPAPTTIDGFPYPSPPYGRSQRSLPIPGSRIQPFQFLGYKNGDPTQGLQTISLLDYYDPCGRRIKLLHISVAAVWCTPCNEETAAVTMAQATITGEGVAMLQALDDGPVQGTGATQGDLDRWVAKYTPTFSEVLDPGLANLGSFFPAAEVPWNADIDPRTMEIIDAQTGWAGDVTTELSEGLSAVQGPPGYPIAVSCN
ncbi:MAG TPA: hypothetical protein VGM06_13150 [Polyangiaceae bacterium]